MQTPHCRGDVLLHEGVSRGLARCGAQLRPLQHLETEVWSQRDPNCGGCQAGWDSSDQGGQGRCHMQAAKTCSRVLDEELKHFLCFVLICCY